MDLERGRAVPIALFSVALLVVSQGLPSFSLAAPASRTPAAGAGPPSSPSFTPDYMLLGQLKGSTVAQSERPRSVPISEGIQFAATYYSPLDLQRAYGAQDFYLTGNNGAGKTIAIIDAYGDPTINQDLAAYDREFGLPAASLSIVPVGPYEPSNGVVYGWDSEVALDVEAAHAMAPYAHINLVVAANASNALFQAVKTVVTRHLGDVVTMSWGLGENSYGESGFSADGFLNYPYLDYWFQVGAAEGISFFASTGDYGAFDGTTTVTASFPATSPFVTAVGGTTLFLTPTSGLISGLNATTAYSGESAWSISPQYIGFQVSSGGGKSALFPQPYYQSGAMTSGARTVPDVAADANPYTGLVVVIEGENFVIGGTSLSSPVWAGMAADLDQFVGKDLGLLNPYLYGVYSDKAEYASAFNQVTSGFNGAYSAGPGYNLVTGLGSPNLPALAGDIRAQAQGLAIDAGTRNSPSPSAPAQFSYGDTMTITATATDPQGSPVTAGSFSAKIQSPGGVVATVPLSYAAGAWTGTYTVSPTDPAGSWSITVSGASGGVAGDGLADVNVGASLAIVAPVPYPFGFTIAPDQAIIIEVTASAPNGTTIAGAVLTARLSFGGETISSVPLVPTGGGYYQGSTQVTAGEPQGTYTLTVGRPGFGSAYSYIYVGEGVVGVMITPNDEAVPSAAPGQLVTFLARTQTAAGDGVFTSNATAKIYSLSGELMASVRLQPAPKSVQFGVFNFFKYQQANYTIPENLTEGFYKLQFISEYSQNGSSETQVGNFTTGFYVSAAPLKEAITSPSAVFEGQYLNIGAKITDSAGAPVTTGVFLATAIPSGYAYEAYVTDFDGFTGVPMQYDQSMGEWVGTYQIPSVLTSPNAFVGNTLSLSSGPWTVSVGGESGGATNVVSSTAYVQVMPYTYYTLGLLSRANVKTAPLVTSNGTSYLLSGVAAGSLSVNGIKITLDNVDVKSLDVTNATVQVVGSQIGSLSVSGGKVSLSASTYQDVSPALPVISVSGLGEPISGKGTFRVSVAGSSLTNGSLAATVDGMAVPLTASANSSGAAATGTIDARSLGDGTHTLSLKATQTDGLSSTLTTYFSTDAQTANSVGALTDALYAALAVALTALALAVYSLARKGRTALPIPPAADPGSA